MKKFTSVVRIPLVDMAGIEAQDHQHHYDPVIDPSDIVGWLLVNDDVRDFSKGLKYLFVLENRSLSDSSYHTGRISYSDQLRKDIPLAMMVNSAADILRKKANMQNDSFMAAIDNLGVLFPEIRTELARFTSSDRLASLILHQALIVRRVMACRSFFPPGTSLVEAANDLVGIPSISLENNDVHFSQYLSWLNLFQGKGMSWTNMLKSVDILIQCKDNSRIRGDSYSDRVEQLLAAVPVAFLGALEASVKQGKPCPSLLGLFSDVSRVVSTAEYCTKHSKKEGMGAIINSAHLLLNTSPELDRTQANLKHLAEVFNFDKGMANLTVSNILPLRPQWVLDHAQFKSDIALTIRALHGAFTNREGSIYAMHFDITTLVKGIENCMHLTKVLREQYQNSEDDVCKHFKAAGDWVRSLTFPGFIPVSLVDILAQLKVEEVASFIAQDEQSKTRMLECLNLIYGKYCKKIFEELAGFPELVTDTDIRELSVEVAGIRTTYREADLHARSPRWLSEMLRPAVFATQIARDTHGVSLEVCTKVLTVLDSVRMLDVQRIDLPPVDTYQHCQGLASFMRECNENPFGIENFMFLMDGFRRKKLYKINPDEFRRMWQCAFDSIIAAPKVFLNKECFAKNISEMEAENWQFAEMEVHDVLRREPLLLYHSLQARFNKTNLELDEHSGVVQK